MIKELSELDCIGLRCSECKYNFTIPCLPVQAKIKMRENIKLKKEYIEMNEKKGTVELKGKALELCNRMNRIKAMTESCDELIQEKTRDMSKRGIDYMRNGTNKKLSQGHIDRHLLTLCDEIRYLRAFIMDD